MTTLIPTLVLKIANPLSCIAGGSLFSENANEKIIFFKSNILFEITTFCSKLRPFVRNYDHLFEFLINYCNLCLSVCLSDHNSAPGPICPKFCFGNSALPMLLKVTPAVYPHLVDLTGKLNFRY